MALPATTDIHRDQNVSATPRSSLAAVELNLRSKEDQSYLADALMSSRRSAFRAWQHYKRLGVVRYPLNRAARIAGATTLHAAMLNEDGVVEGPIKRGDANEACIDIVKGIYSRMGGVRGLIERYFLLQKVPADSHLIKVKVRGGYDGYMFLSPGELRGPTGMEFDPTATLSELHWQTSPGVAGRPARSRPLARKDYLGRVWSPSPEYIDLADSPLYTLDADCDLLWRLLTILRGQYRNRAMISAMLFFPDSLNRLASGQHVAHRSEDLVATMNEVFSENVELAEQGDSADIMPILLSGQADAGKQIAEIVLGQETKDTDLKLRAELIDNILFSLDINTRATKGDSQNHFSAWSDSADELRLAVIPDVQAMCWAFTRLILHRELVDMGWEPERIRRCVVAYDLSEASVRINKQEDARQLNDRGGLSLRTSRRVGGFTEDDAPTDDEYIRQYGFISKNPYLALWGIDLPEDFDWDKAMPKGVGRPQDSQGDDPESQPGEGDPGSPDDSDADKPDDAK